MNMIISKEEARRRISGSRMLAAVKELMQSARVKLWPVGGCIRDCFFARDCSDIDMIVDTAESGKVQELVSGLAGRLGGTVVPLDCERGYWRLADIPQGHLDFAAMQADSIEKDLGKRDFTINAITWDMERDDFFDPYGGIDDCQNKRLRSLSEKNLAFDPLRSLRAWRFLCTLGLSPDAELEGQIRRQVRGLERIAGERINEELYKTFAGDILGHYDFACKTGLTEVLWPEVRDSRQTVKKRLRLWKRWYSERWGSANAWGEAEWRYWDEDIRCERRRCMLVGLALLLGSADNCGSLSARFGSRAYLDKVSKRFSLSRKERNILYLIGLNAQTAELLLQGQASRGEWFDFFRRTGQEAAAVLLYVWLGAADEQTVGYLPGNAAIMLRDFFERGSAYCPQVPLAVKLILERYPQLQGCKIGELTEYLARRSAIQGGLSEQQSWDIVGDFMKQYEEIGWKAE